MRPFHGKFNGRTDAQARTDVRTDGQGQTDRRTDGRTDAQARTDVRTDGQGQTDRRTDGGGRLVISTFKYVLLTVQDPVKFSVHLYPHSIMIYTKP